MWKQQISRSSIRTFGLLWIFLIPALVPTVFGQSVKKLTDSFPSVYLTYDGTAKRQSRCESEKAEHIILQLHNNTNTYINVAADFNSGLETSIVETIRLPDDSFIKTLEAGSEAELYYDVEGLYRQKGYGIPKRSVVPHQPDPYCSCSYLSSGKNIEYSQDIGYWIKPGGYIKFAVPRQLSVENSRIYTEFNYLCEYTNGKLAPDEPRHKVMFYNSDLPAELPH